MKTGYQNGKIAKGEFWETLHPGAYRLRPRSTDRKSRVDSLSMTDAADQSSRSGHDSGLYSHKQSRLKVPCYIF